MITAAAILAAVVAAAVAIISGLSGAGLMVAGLLGGVVGLACFLLLALVFGGIELSVESAKVLPFERRK